MYLIAQPPDSVICSVVWFSLGPHRPKHVTELAHFFKSSFVHPNYWYLLWGKGELGHLPSHKQDFRHVRMPLSAQLTPLCFPLLKYKACGFHNKGAWKHGPPDQLLCEGFELMLLLLTAVAVRKFDWLSCRNPSGLIHVETSWIYKGSSGLAEAGEAACVPLGWGREDLCRDELPAMGPGRGHVSLPEAAQLNPGASNCSWLTWHNHFYLSISS